jgi:hypothetical protein
MDVLLDGLVYVTLMMPVALAIRVSSERAFF